MCAGGPRLHLFSSHIIIENHRKSWYFLGSGGDDHWQMVSPHMGNGSRSVFLSFCLSPSPHPKPLPAASEALPGTSPALPPTSKALLALPEAFQTPSEALWVASEAPMKPSFSFVTAVVLFKHYPSNIRFNFHETRHCLEGRGNRWPCNAFETFIA